MKHKQLFRFVLSIVAVLALSAPASAQFARPPAYQLIGTIPVPAESNPVVPVLSSYDISWVDPASQRYYLADRTATLGTGRIDVIDTRLGKFLYSIPTNKAEVGFAGTVPGFVHSGPNGVVAIPQLNQLYVGDGNSTVKVVDLAAKAIVAVIPTGGTARADELAYDPLDRIIMITNPNDSPPFVTFISVDTQTVVGRYTYPSAQSGLEQQVWNPLTKRFYMSVPATAGSGGHVDVINPTTMLVESSFSTTSCSPAGLALTPNQHLMTSCGVLLDARRGNVVSATSGESADEIWYNPGDNRYYFGATNAAVIDADTNQFLTYLPTTGGHTLAVDPNNNHIFVPVTGVGIQVFAAQ
jgi:hypothetical protein